MLKIFKKRILKLRRRQEGAAAVEFAIILPVLMLLVLGGMDMGDMYFMQHVITNASREGARYAAKYSYLTPQPTSSQISDFVKLSSGLDYNSFNFPNFTVSASYSGTSPNEVVTVTVHANKYWWILGSLLPDPKTLTAETAMAVEGP
jgi:Flp pilus assembly protein TadG